MQELSAEGYTLKQFELRIESGPGLRRLGTSTIVDRLIGPPSSNANTVY